LFDKQAFCSFVDFTGVRFQIPLEPQKDARFALDKSLDILPISIYYTIIQLYNYKGGRDGRFPD